MNEVVPANRPVPLGRPPSPEQVTAWLDYELEPLIARRAELVAAIEATVKKYAAGIVNDDQQGIAAENLRMANAAVRAAADAHELHKRPYLEAGRAVDRWKNGYSVPLADPIERLTRLMLAYSDRREAESRAAAQAEADRLAAEAAAQAKAAEREAPSEGMFGPASEAAYEKTLAAVRAQDAADARPAEHTRVRGVAGAVASVRVAWGWETENFAKVHRRFLMVNPDAIAAEVRAKGRDAKTGRPLAVIAGIKWVAKRAMGVR